jgi:hypothetical protein
MYAVVRRYAIEQGKMDDIRNRLEGDFADLIATTPGFVSYQAFDDGATLTAVSTFQSQAEAEASSELASRWLTENPGLLTSRIDIYGGEVFTSRTA